MNEYTLVLRTRRRQKSSTTTNVIIIHTYTIVRDGGLLREDKTKKKRVWSPLKRTSSALTASATGVFLAAALGIAFVNLLCRTRAMMMMMIKEVGRSDFVALLRAR